VGGGRGHVSPIRTDASPRACACAGALGLRRAGRWSMAQGGGVGAMHCNAPLDFVTSRQAITESMAPRGSPVDRVADPGVGGPRCRPGASSCLSRQAVELALSRSPVASVVPASIRSRTRTLRAGGGLRRWGGRAGVGADDGTQAGVRALGGGAEPTIWAQLIAHRELDVLSEEDMRGTLSSAWGR
jgi:hypothetical protein